MVTLVFKWLHIVNITELCRHLFRSNASLQLLNMCSCVSGQLQSSQLLFSDIFHLLRFVRFAKLETKYFRQKLCKLIGRFLTSLWYLDISLLLLRIVIDWMMLLCSFSFMKSSHIFWLLFLLKILRQFFLTLYFSGSTVTVLSIIESGLTCLVLVISWSFVASRFGEVLRILRTDSLH